jgi:hypothetical protein
MNTIYKFQNFIIVNNPMDLIYSMNKNMDLHVYELFIKFSND